MASSWGKKGAGGGGHSWSTEDPANKRRKVEEKSHHLAQEGKHEENKDDWGDDEEFTQDELEAIELLASQAINQPKSSLHVQTREQASDVSFVAPTSAVRSVVNRSMSSSSDSSVYAQSITSRSTIETSGTLSSHSSSNDKLDVSREVVQTLQTKLDEEKRRAQEEKYRFDGEVKSLRERLHKQEEEMEKLRSLRDESNEQQQQTLTEQILKLKSQLGSATSQNQFKERECQSLLEQVTILQQKVKQFQQQPHHSVSGQSDVSLPLSPKPASPRKVSVQPSPPSKQKLLEMKESAGLTKSVFPTTNTFLEQTVSSSYVSPTQSATSGASCQTAACATKPPQRRRLQLNAGASKAFGEMTGPQLVRHLLQVSDRETTFEPQEEKAQSDPGLVSLLHDMSTSLRIAGLYYSREKDSSFLTPLRPKRHIQGLGSTDKGSGDGTVQVVSRQNLHLAVEGLTLLLDDNKDNKDKCEQSSDLGVPQREQTSCSRNSGAVMLLPLLTDYIQHYVDLIHSSFGKVSTAVTPVQNSVTSPQSLDSSYDSSFDSLSSQLGLLMHEGKIYACNVEGCAVTALRCLVILIRLCPVVRHTIITARTGVTATGTVNTSSTTTSSSSTTGTETEQQSKKTLSGVEADDEYTSSSSEIRVIRGAANESLPSLGDHHGNNRVSLSLLHLVMRLAGQDLEDSQSNPEVVQLALRVLTCLCQYSTEEELSKLEIIITRGILTNSLKQTKHMLVLVCAQRLLLSLVKSEKLLARLCTKSENCPLYLLHRACSMKGDGMFDLRREYIISLSSIISQHRSGMYFLLSSACPCADECVAAVILALYHLFSTFKTTGSQHKDAVLNTLAQGVILIHSLAQGDNAFTQHYMAVQPQYVRLISGLLSIMRSNRKKWELQLSALKELNDFEPDSSDTSQESEGEDKMDQE